MKDLMPVETHLILNMQRGSFKDHLKRCRKTIMCSCSVSDIQYPWIGLKDQLSSHLSQCSYEQIRPILNQILEENHRLKQKLNKLKEK
ncbi:unnamed protein product [Adineta steineri]|uniref:Uncharacterized protein n=1 Tax=Adineta steineri TaxID=433720 RepID=A0A815H249_9BILA|nr:unnamed protein product [Adineta steineri]CAF3876793.1 unnamed protein product [Adineta steineri]